ncbi:efflux RND transporter permease subunit [Elizabethkingia ursingii]|uniref:efflux RND transporter permease subunit n=1 Tax=Elizabethkingia ursingii TaxID=1756150 RepID=UPI0020131C0C|nr:efflux RND transporter permease subunit [Elizabethkingia ursingii]MCL1668171.1 efflux RND transporter permease subunit [Elizabethkingia ursingii]
MNFLEAAMKYKQVVIVLVVLLIILGINSILNMSRSENPRIDMPVAAVYAFYPGADEHQVEQEVAKKIEQYLFSFEEIKKKKVKAEVKEGQVFFTVEMNANVKDRKKFWHTLQLDMDANLRPKLPSGVVGPFVNSNFANVTAMIISISSKDRSYADIESYVDKLEDGLKVIPTISKINRSGGQRQQIYVKINDKKLQQYGFGVNALVNTIQQQNITGYSGEISNGSNAIIPIYTNSRYKNISDISEQIIYTTPTGNVVRLKDVAELERRFEEPSSFIRAGDEKAMVLTVDMQPGNNIVAFGKEVEKKIEEIQKDFPQDIHMKTIVNQPKTVGESINHFMVEFAMSIASVVLVVLLLLPVRVAGVASAAAPISLIITFGIMQIVGLELHQVTLAALIIVLGMVVDNAIVVVDNYIEKLDEGLPPWTAAWKAAQQLALPIFTATMAIIFAFAPLALFMEGIAKDFMFSLPITVAIALITSMLVALFLTPYTCYIFIKKGLKHKVTERPPRKNMLDHLQTVFDNGVGLAFKWPRTTILIGVMSIVTAIFIATKIDMEFFPMSERDQFNMEVWMPNGTSLEKTEAKVKELEKILKKDNRVVDITSFVGMSSPRFHTTYAPESPKLHFAQVFITTVDNDATNEMAKEYLEKLKNFIPDGYLKVKQLSFQEGSPIEIRVVSDNEADQRKVALEVKKILENTPGTNNVRLNSEYDYMGVKLNVDDIKANRLGVTNQAITQTLGAGLKGYSISTLWEGDKPVDIFLRYDSVSRKDMNALENLHIQSHFGGKIPLKEVATLQPEWHTGVISRKNGIKYTSVLAEAQLGPKPSRILKEAQSKIDALALPAGTSIQYGGDAESTIENTPGMLISLSVSLILIFLTLLFQFKSLGKALIILCTFLLSLFGAFFGLFITGNPLGMTGFMGIISLIGIVVRNGIILVDYADELVREHGYRHKAAAMAAAKRRMRPIFLTSAAAAVGVVPMILGKSPMWAPLGSVLAFGLIFSMIFTLFIVPVMYCKLLKEPAPKNENSKDQLDSEVILYNPKPNH